MEKQLPDGRRVAGVGTLHGGWTSAMRLLTVSGPGEQPFFVRHAEGPLTREADVPAAAPLALDALAFAPDAEKVAAPWRALGRADLTPTLLTARLEDYLHALFAHYAAV